VEFALYLEAKFFKYRTMLSTLLVVAASLALAFGDKCIPDQTGIYWKSPCDGQTFPNRITPTAVTVTQAGQLVDQRGGLDLELPIDIVATIVNDYGETTTPVVDLAIWEYATPITGGKCQWKELPTFGMLDNIDACTMIENCHMTGKPTTLKASVDVKAIAGPLLHLVTKDAYYGLTLTFKDQKQPIVCVYIQDIVHNV